MPAASCRSPVTSSREASSATETTDPTVQTGIAVSQPYLQNLYDRLTYIVPNTWQVQPQLATSWSSHDGKTWTFKLRSGVKFHNGKTLDSKDVKWSYSHILDKKNGSSAYARLADECRECPVGKVCGGGNYVHRYAPGSGFLHPSVYCADLERLIRHVAHRLNRTVSD